MSAIIITIRDGRARIYRECEHCGSEVAPRALARCRVCRRMVCPDCMDKGCTICRECAEWGSGHADIPELCRARERTQNAPNASEALATAANGQ